MSHGNDDSFATSNSELMSFEEIMEPIKACPTLLNKLKMFFFQPCRGDKEMESNRGSQMSDHHEINSSSYLQSNMNKNIATKFDDEFDLLIGCSTLACHLSVNVDKEEGSFFIKSFCNGFNDAYKNMS